MILKQGTTLERGKYRIDGVLGQGGFGITYLGEQIYLGRKVAIKEFFMDGICVRDDATQAVTAPADTNRGLVERFRRKFIKEAQNIARLKHRGIVPIIDIFEENGTAYYVMEHLPGGSLAGKVKQGALPEREALRYIGQVAAALEYVHSQRIMHLDVKPANILLDEDDNAVLIDFGLAKQYDSTGHQTSTTPVGISHGYAPLEQYKQGGVEQFTPATDVYSLGATLYKLVTGNTPPEASDVINQGLPAFPPSVSPAVQKAITAAMQPAVMNRPQSVAEFLALLGGEGQKPVPPVVKPVEKTPGPTVVTETAVNDAGSADNAGKGGGVNWSDVRSLFVIVALALALFYLISMLRGCGEGSLDDIPDLPVYPVVDTSGEEPDANRRVVDSLAVHKHYKDSVAKADAERKAKEEAERKRREDERIAAEKAHKEAEKKEAECKRQEAANSSFGTIAGRKYVDLDLPSGLKWATCNVGANSPEDYGDYYAWGETSTKSCYTYKNCTTYCKVISDIGGNAQYDVARTNWGSSWRLPTKAEFDELLNEDNCTWFWTTQGGKNGYKVISKRNGNSIFLPAAGYRSDTSQYYDGSKGLYWSSTPNGSDPSSAYRLYFDSSYRNIYWSLRDCGLSVRPVSK